MRVDEVGRFAVVLRCPRAITAGGGDHRQAFEAIVHLGIALEEILGGVFGLVEAARVDQVDDDVRRLIETVILGADGGLWRESFGLTREEGGGACGGRALGRGGGVPRPAAALIFLATAAGTGIVAPRARGDGGAAWRRRAGLVQRRVLWWRRATEL